MYSSKLFKNFLIGDCLKDYLDIYRPLPSKSRPNPFPESTPDILRLLKDHVSRTTPDTCHAEQLKQTHEKQHNPEVPLDVDLASTDLLFDINITNGMYREHIRCMTDKSRLFHSYKVSSADVYILFFNIENKLRTRMLYYQAKFYIIRQILSELYGKKVKVAFLNLSIIVSKDEINTLFITEIEKWKSARIEPFVDEAFTYVQMLCDEGKNWSIDEDKPSNHLLYPNLGLRADDQYSEIREKLAWKWKDLSLLYFIGPVTRRLLHDRGVYTLDHHDLLHYIQSGPKSVVRTTPLVQQTQKIMIQHMFEPVVPIQVQWAPTDFFKQFAYIDIETSYRDNKSICNLVGILYFQDSSWTYKYFLSKDDGCLATSKEFLESEMKDLTLVHYTDADKVAIPSSLKSYDLYESVTNVFVTSEPLQSLHLNNFKLKTIYRKMCERLDLENLYESCSVKNGMEALYVLTDYQHCDITDVEGVIKYNRVDVIALFLLHLYIQQNFDEKFLELCSHREEELCIKSDEMNVL